MYLYMRTPQFTGLAVVGTIDTTSIPPEYEGETAALAEASGSSWGRPTLQFGDGFGPGDSMQLPMVESPLNFVREVYADVGLAASASVNDGVVAMEGWQGQLPLAVPVVEL